MIRDKDSNIRVAQSDSGGLSVGADLVADVSETVVVQRRWRFRLEPTVEQAAVLTTQGHTGRAMWNKIHEWWLISSDNRLPTLKALSEAVKQGRRDIPWLAALPAQAAQAVERSYVKSWRACWGGAGRVGAPKFKARDKTLLSVDLPQAAHFRLRKVSDKYGELHIMKVGKVRFRQHRRFPKTANITGARVFFKGGQWWISFRLTLVQTKVELTRRQASARVGGDRGIKVPLYMSDGEKFEHGPWLSEPEQRRLLLLERRSARQRHLRWNRVGKKARKGANEQATYAAIAAVRGRARRRREDWQHQVSHQIGQRYSQVAFEDLRVQNMMASAAGTIETPGKKVSQKRGLNRAIGEEGWSALQLKVAYKVAGAGGEFQVVRAAGTSKQCHQCGSDAEGQRKNQAWFLCANPGCGWSGNADFNAAKNVEHRAFGKGAEKDDARLLAAAGGLPDADRPGHTPGKPPNLQGKSGTSSRGISSGPGRGNNTQTHDWASAIPVSTVPSGSPLVTAG